MVSRDFADDSSGENKIRIDGKCGTHNSIVDDCGGTAAMRCDDLSCAC